MKLLLKVLISGLLVTIFASAVQSGDNYDRSVGGDNDSDEQLKTVDDDLSYAESVRNVRLIDDGEQWHGVQRIQNEDDRPLETRPQKRRRLRKRKRRPQHMQKPQQQQPQFADEQQGEIQIVRPRRRRPIRLDEVDDGWKEMEAEVPQRPYSRRRVGPVYQEDSTLKVSPSSQEIPQSTARNVALNTEHTTSLKDIKDILKQTGGLSLSEILLQKNLTLNDLLQGNQNAILALSERPVQAVTEKQVISEVEVKEIVEPIREVPPPVLQEIKESADINRKEEQRKRFSQLYNQDNKIYSDVTTKYEVVTEATTEKRIFVPSHPKYYTSVNFKPEFEIATEAPRRKLTPSKLPMTSAQMNRVIKKVEPIIVDKTPVKTSLPPIPLSDMFGYQPEDPIEITSKGPLKMSLDLEELPEQNVVLPDKDKDTPQEFEKNFDQTTIRFVELTTEEPMTTTTAMTTSEPQTVKTLLDLELIEQDSNYSPVSEKLTTTQRFYKKFSTTTKPTTTTPLPKKVSVSAKEEIMEIMRNSDVKEELEELLTSRNMTVEQLVEQRERGSSQRHLAEIFHNKTKEPEAVEVVEEINTHKPFKAPAIDYNKNRKPKIFSTTSRTTSTTTTTTTTTTVPPQPETTANYPVKPLEDVSMSSEEITVSEKLPSTSFPTYKIETNKMSKEIPPLHIPIWKTIYPSIYIESEHNNKKLELDAIEQSIQQAVDDGLNELSRVNNNLNEYDDYIQLPIGVKSAIFASLAIIGMSLVLFLTILVVFRWSQKHKKRLCYANGAGGGGFTCSKIKSPILQHEPKRTIRTFVSETLGKRRNFYAQHFRQSMSDSWESNERPYQ